MADKPKLVLAPGGLKNFIDTQIAPFQTSLDNIANKDIEKGVTMSTLRGNGTILESDLPIFNDQKGNILSVGNLHADTRTNGQNVIKVLTDMVDSILEVYTKQTKLFKDLHLNLDNTVTRLFDGQHESLQKIDGKVFLDGLGTLPGDFSGTGGQQSCPRGDTSPTSFTGERIMADNSNDKAPAYSSNDTWADAVKLLTGYNLPPRGEIFKDKLYGNDDIPLMKLQIDDWDVEPDLAEICAINAMSWRTKNSGWRPEGWDTDFVVPFYSGPAGVGSTVHMKKARSTLLGTDADHHVPAGGVDAGATFGAGSRLMPDGFKGWDSTFLGSYSYGGGRALEELLKAPHYTTYGFSWNNIHVDNLQAVDLTGFDRAAKAFDRAARIFHLSRTTIQSWQDEDGNTEDAAWRGQAAGVFWDSIRQLGNIYQNYEDALPLQGVFSAAGNDLRQARQGIYNAVSALYGTWSTWALYEGNPLRWRRGGRRGGAGGGGGGGRGGGRAGPGARGGGGGGAAAT